MAKIPKPPKPVLSAQDFLKEISNGSMVQGQAINEEIRFEGDLPQFTVIDCEFSGQLVFSGGTYEAMSFQVCHFNKPFGFIGGTFSEVKFEDCIFHGLMIFGGTFNSNFDVKWSQLVRLQIGGKPKFEQEISFHGKEKDKSQRNIAIADLSFKGVKDIRFEQYNIYGLILTNRIDDDTQVLIKDCDLCEVEIRNLDNKGFVRFNNCIPKKREGALKMTNSDLGKMNFQNMDLRQFKEIVIHTSDLDGVSTNNVSWPRKISKNGLKRRQLVTAYRQLKMLAKREGDKRHELRFSARERKVLFAVLPWYRIWDRFSLGINWLSNNFNQTWLLPLLWLFAINYWLYSETIDIKLIDAWRYYGDFFIYLNPVHKADFVYDIKDIHPPTNGWQVWDFLGRVVSGYFYVQIVAGFRKYAKA